MIESAGGHPARVLRPSTFVSLALVACAAPQPSAAQTAPNASALVLTGAHVLDERGAGWIDGSDVLVVGSKIERIGPAGSLAAPADARRIDLAGRYLVPGLIDLHSHLLLHPYDETPWDDQVLKESLELRTIRATVAAKTTLEAGFTTLRDLGTEGAGFADVALRDAIAKGMIPGPRIFASTRAIVATGCYGPGAGFDPRWSLPKGAEEASGVRTTAARRGLRRRRRSRRRSSTRSSTRRGAQGGPSRRTRRRTKGSGARWSPESGRSSTGRA